MPSDPAAPASPLPPPAGSGESARQEEALLRALLARIQASGDKTHLRERSEAALRLILNRPRDQALRDRLMADITRLTAALPDDVGTASAHKALATAAEACLAILRAAEQHRVTDEPPPPRPEAGAGPDHQAAAVHRHPAPLPHPHPHPHPPSEEEREPSSRLVVAVLVVLLVLLAGGVAIGLRGRGGADALSRPLVAQIAAAAHGTIPPTNVYGGALRVTAQGGQTVVTVEGVPASECVSAGWDLVHTGLLTVNGVTPNRVSAAKLNELCHASETATLSWAPKEQ